ncbi:glutamyl-tRNA reductase [Janibacter sp. GXQ6167]|uniref:glutamyl-tRNA reductase n=1 Tax=Janibacter sp. GXQ6167 TaxID=3240791 RepID=UPI00352573E1
MSLLVFGLSHRRAPLSLLERASLDATSRELLISAAAASADIAELVVVSTCNRTEVYAEVTAFHGAVADLTTALTHASGVTVDDLKDHLDLHYGDAAVGHVFNVAAGLDSMAVGEAQILGQLRDALAAAQEGGHAGPALNHLVQQALRVGKRVHSETGIDAVSRSLVGAGLDRAERSVGPVSGARVLVVGAGAMSGLAATTARRRGAAALTIVNRTYARAEHLAERLDGVPRPIEELDQALAEADIVISCTGSTGTVIDLARAADAQVSRGGNPQVYLDLALPHDVAREADEMTGVTVIGLAELGEELAADGTAPQVAAAQALVADEVGQHLAARAADLVAPTVRALRGAATDVMNRELARLEARTPDLTEAERAEVRLAMHRVVEKLLHTPTVRVKQLAVDGRIGHYEDAIRQLFDLHGEAL